MRGAPLVMAWLLAGCSLYFGPNPQADGGPPVYPDAHSRLDGGIIVIPPDAMPPADAMRRDFTFAACVDGAVYRSAPQDTDIAPPDVAAHGSVIARCAGRCRGADDVYECLGDRSCAGATAWLCEPDATCPTSSTCTGDATTTCEAPAACAIEVETESCTCANGSQQCTSSCGDGLCSPVQVLRVLAGRWRGTVTPPSFAEPYQVELVIGADGHLDPHALTETSYRTAFYYGQDGGDPDCWFQIIGETPTGGVGFVGVEFSPSEILPGLVTAVRVDASHLRFHFWDSWLGGCVRRFDFDLARVP